MAQSEVTMIGRNPFSILASVYDDIMQDIEYAEWAQYIAEFLKPYPPPQTLLDLACGTGNSTHVLGSLCDDIMGIDASEDMLIQAKRKLPHVVFKEAGLTEFSLSKRFDLITCLFDSLNNLTDPQDLQAALFRIRDHLQPDGWFVADINTPLGVQELWEGEAIEGLALTEQGDEVHYHWSHHHDAETELGVVQAFFRFEDQTYYEIHSERGYSTKDLEPMLKKAGFGRFYFHEYPHFDAPHPEARRIWVFAQA